MVEKTSPLDIPLEVRSRMDAWYALFMGAMYSHYFFGVVGVAAATISAATGGALGKALAAVSAICLAVLGFVQPDRKYLKFSRAWSILDIAALRYRYGEATLAELMDALDSGEQMIAEFEHDTQPRASSKPQTHI
jgi:hypothetical protein